MQRCTQSAAGGTIQRLKPGPATVRDRENQPPVSLDTVSILVSSPRQSTLAGRQVTDKMSQEQTDSVPGSKPLRGPDMRLHISVMRPPLETTGGEVAHRRSRKKPIVKEIGRNTI